MELVYHGDCPSGERSIDNELFEGNNRTLNLNLPSQKQTIFDAITKQLEGV